MALSKFSIGKEEEKISQFSVGDEPISKFSIDEEGETDALGVATSVGAGLASGVLSIPKFIGEAAEILSDLTGLSHGTLGEESRKAQDFLRTKMGDSKAEQLIGQAAEAIGTMGSQAAAVVATGGSISSVLPLLAAGAGVDKTSEALREGQPALNAYGAGFAQAATEYLTEKIPFGILQRKGLSFITRLAGGVISDIPGELLATATELSLIDKEILGKDRHLTTDQYVQILKDTAAVSAITTIGITGVSQVGHTIDTLNRMKPLPEQKPTISKEKTEVVPVEQVNRESSKSEFPELAKQENPEIPNSDLELRENTKLEPDTPDVLPQNPSEKPEFKEWSSIMDASRSKSLEKRKLSFSNIKKSFVRAFVDVSGNVQSALSKLGPEGKRVVMQQNAIGGASSLGTKMATKAKKFIFDGFKPAQQQMFDDFISAKRHLELRGIHGAEYTLPGNATEQMLIDHIEATPVNLREQFEQRSESWSKSMGEILGLMETEGLLTPDQQARLRNSGKYYVPRQVLDYIDPEIQVKNSAGKTITTRDSGLKNLSKDGSEQLIETDSELLLEQAYQRAYTRVFKNRAGLAILNLSRTNKDASKIVREGRPNEKPRQNEMSISVMENGQRKEMIMPIEYGTEWVTGDPLIPATMANIISWVSGNKILKAMATTLNPAFAITNVPRDIAHVWFTTEQYSSFAPKAALQMAGDIASVLKDFKHWDNIYTENGGGMEFLSLQGKGKLKGVTAITKVMSVIQDVLSSAGTFSEKLTRFALTRRSMRNGNTPFEATQIARGYLDFARGGSVSKAINSAVPFFNASVQATRGIARAAKNNPSTFGVKAFQIGAMATGLYLANRSVYGDDIDDVPDYERKNNWVVMTPYTYMDKDNNQRRYYITIPKDQGQRVIADVFENFTRQSRGEQVDWPDMVEAVGNYLPIMPGDLLPPVMEMMLGYSANKDFWRNEDIWKGADVIPQEEYTKYTPETFVKAGEVTGLSPERLRYATKQVFTSGNLWTSMVGYASNEIFSELTPVERAKHSEEQLSKVPGLKRLLKTTRPASAEIKKLKEEKIRTNTERLQLNRKFDSLTDKFFNGETDLREVNEYLRRVPEDRKRLRNRFEAQRKLKNVTNKSFWFNLLDLPPEARAVNYWNKWVQLDEQGRHELDVMSYRVPRLRSKQFNLRFNKMRKFNSGRG